MTIADKKVPPNPEQNLPCSDELQLRADIVGIRVLIKGGTVKEFEDRKLSLLNNPQWRSAIAKRRKP